MASPTPTTPSFPQFNRLPPELRRLIWTLSLPSPSTPSFAVYTPDWPPLFAAPPGPLSIFSDLQPHLLPRVQLPTPAALFVNRESRAVTTAWATTNNLHLHLRPETNGHVYSRFYLPDVDTVYVSESAWTDFVTLKDAWYEVDEDAIERLSRAVQSLAVPAFRAYYSVEKLAWLLDWMPRVNRIYVVWDGLPRRGILGEDGGLEGGVQQRYELERVEGGDEAVVGLDVGGEGVVGDWGTLGEFKGEMAEEWKGVDVPGRFGDLITEVVRLPLVHVRARMGGW